MRLAQGGGLYTAGSRAAAKAGGFHRKATACPEAPAVHRVPQAGRRTQVAVCGLRATRRMYTGPSLVPPSAFLREFLYQAKFNRTVIMCFGTYYSGGNTEWFIRLIIVLRCRHESHGHGQVVSSHGDTCGQPCV